MMKMETIIRSIPTILPLFRIILLPTRLMRVGRRFRNRRPLLMICPRLLLLLLKQRKTDLVIRLRAATAAANKPRSVLGRLPVVGERSQRAALLPSLNASKTLRPLNGRKEKPAPASSRSSCVRAFYACARAALRVCGAIKGFFEALTFIDVERVFRRFLFRERARCRALRNLFPYPGEASQLVCGLFASAVTACIIYGFMRCQRDCVSSLVCVSFLDYNYSNCPMSWRKPEGRAGVRTHNPCHMVRKDTNSKMKK